jgi:hypothetical protein
MQLKKQLADAAARADESEAALKDALHENHVARRLIEQVTVNPKP